MALRAKSLFLFGYEVTSNNRSLDFKSAALGPILQATLNLGYYSLTSLLLEVARALNAADPANVYSATANRTYVGGTENRISVLSSGIYLDILFLTGPRTASNCASLLGFTVTDQTGATTYTGTLTTGTALISEYVAYTYLSIEEFQDVFGAINISVDGTKEAVVFQIQKFFQAEFKYEPEAKVKTQWLDLWTWLIQQRLFEFAPEITSPTVFYEATLEKSSASGKGMGFKMQEMLPNFPFNYQTGLLVFRLNIR